MARTGEGIAWDDGSAGPGDVEVGDAETGAGEFAPSGAVRPQALLMTLCGQYLLDRPGLLHTGSFVEALTRCGTGTHAARTTLTRMAQRGLLDRHRIGGKVYLSLSERFEQVLRDGQARVWTRGAVNRSWTGEWTLLSFSLPESRRADRHQLRKRLGWEGFGLLHSGLWISPSAVDVTRVLSDLGLEREVKSFRATAVPPTDVQELVEDAWDLGALAARYARFLAAWSGPDSASDSASDSGPDDVLARYLMLVTEWLLLVRIDPHLPVELLPADWPAVPAEQLVGRLRAQWEAPARQVFEGFAERRPAGRPGGGRRAAQA